MTVPSAPDLATERDAYAFRRQMEREERTAMAPDALEILVERELARRDRDAAMEDA